MKSIKSKSLNEVISKVKLTEWYAGISNSVRDIESRISDIKRTGEYVCRDLYEELSTYKELQDIRYPMRYYIRGYNENRPYMYSSGGHTFLDCIEFKDKNGYIVDRSYIFRVPKN